MFHIIYICIEINPQNYVFQSSYFNCKLNFEHRKNIEEKNTKFLGIQQINSYLSQ